MTMALALRYPRPRKEPATPRQIEAQVYAIIAAVLDVDAPLVVSTARFREDLGADSLDLAALIVAFGRAFEGSIHDHEVGGITTVGETVAYIQQALVGL